MATFDYKAATSAGDTYVDFVAPDKEKFLTGKSKKMTARVVLYDSVSKRTSAVTANKVLTLKAGKTGPPWLLIGGGVFGGVVLLLLLVAIARGGGGRRRR